MPPPPLLTGNPFSCQLHLFLHICLRVKGTAWGSLYLLWALCPISLLRPWTQTKDQTPLKKERRKTSTRSIGGLFKIQCSFTLFIQEHPALAREVCTKRASTSTLQRQHLTVFQAQLQRLWFFCCGFELNTHGLEQRFSARAHRVKITGLGAKLKDSRGHQGLWSSCPGQGNRCF